MLTHSLMLTYSLTHSLAYFSDFDDNVGHWQVVPHPTKPNYSRVLYSAEVKPYSLPPLLTHSLTHS